MARRTQVTASLLDEEGYPYLVFKGNAQDVADACAIYILNIADPLCGTPLIDLLKRRDKEEP